MTTNANSHEHSPPCRYCGAIEDRIPRIRVADHFECLAGCEPGAVARHTRFQIAGLFTFGNRPHACLSSDCPHEKWADCADAIRAEILNAADTESMLERWITREDPETGHLTVVAKVDNAFDVTVGAIGSHRARCVSVYPPEGSDVERFGSELVKIRRVR